MFFGPAFGKLVYMQGRSAFRSVRNSLTVLIMPGERNGCKLKMNILLVTMSLGIGGVETHISELAKELIKRGNNVCIAANEGIYSETLRAAGAEILILPLDSRSPKAIVSSYRGLKRYILNRKKQGSQIDLIHAHARIPCMICGRLHKNFHGEFHYVTTAHGVYSKLPGEKYITDWGEHSLAVSDDVKKFLVDCYGVSPNNIDITVNGINTECFAPAGNDEQVVKITEILGFSSSCRHRVMHVSRIDSASSDAAYQLIESIPELYKRYSDIEIIIIGDGTEYDALKKKADEMNNLIGRKAVFLLGARTDIARILSCGDCFVGVSRAALEAMSCGLPVILAGAQGFFGIFDESEESLNTAMRTNFCFRDMESSSSDKLTKALIEIFGYDKDKLLSMGMNGRNIVTKYYSVSKMADDAEKMYSSVMKN